jgi:hypothetical protein
MIRGRWSAADRQFPFVAAVGRTDPWVSGGPQRGLHIPPAHCSEQRAQMPQPELSAIPVLRGRSETEQGTGARGCDPIALAGFAQRAAATPR